MNTKTITRLVTSLLVVTGLAVSSVNTASAAGFKRITLPGGGKNFTKPFPGRGFGRPITHPGKVIRPGRGLDVIGGRGGRIIDLDRKHPRPGKGRSRGRGIGGFVAGAMLVAAANSRSSRGASDGYMAAKRRCASKYRSFDWESDTYIAKGGRVKTCKFVKRYL